MNQVGQLLEDSSDSDNDRLTADSLCMANIYLEQSTDNFFQND